MLTTTYTKPQYSQARLNRIAAQLERYETKHEPNPQQNRKNPRRDPLALHSGATITDQISIGTCQLGGVHVRLKDWQFMFAKLVGEMREQSKQAFSLRTQQISVLCAFIPFVLSVVGAALRYLPRLPTLTLWAKLTWFFAFPMFLAMAGALVGFLIGVMLDSLEHQGQAKPHEPNEDHPVSPDMGAGDVERTGVWVATDDLQPNQRIAETVEGTDGKPILLRHTVLRPNHIELLKKHQIDQVKVESAEFSPDHDLAAAS